MEREIMRLLYFYSLNKKIFDELAFERIYNIFIKNDSLCFLECSTTEVTSNFTVRPYVGLLKELNQS